MVCWRWGNMLSGAGLICDLVRSSSLIDHTWIVDRATGPCDERQPAGGATCSWLPDRERRLQGNHAAQAIFGEWPVSAHCSRWLPTRRMGEVRMGGFSWLDPATTAAGDPHSRSLRRPKPVYSGLILWRCWATPEHGIGSVATGRAGMVIDQLQPNSSAQRTRSSQKYLKFPSQPIWASWSVG